jgi:hypothetical protein
MLVWRSVSKGFVHLCRALLGKFVLTHKSPKNRDRALVTNIPCGFPATMTVKPLL